MSRYVRVPLGDTPPKKPETPGASHPQTSAGAETSGGARTPESASSPARPAPHPAARPAAPRPQGVPAGPASAPRSRIPLLLIGGLLLGAGVVLYVLAKPRADRR